MSIKQCSTDWGWFQDDDIELNVDEVNTFCGKLYGNLADLVLVQIGSF